MTCLGCAAEQWVPCWNSEKVPDPKRESKGRKEIYFLSFEHSELEGKHSLIVSVYMYAQCVQLIDGLHRNRGC